MPSHPFAFREFRFFWLSRLTTMLAQSTLVLGIGWQVYDIARLDMNIEAASLRLGLIGLVQFLPVLVLTPVSGLVADRMDRRHIARASVLTQLMGAALLAWLGLERNPSLHALYLVALAMGIARAFYMPAMNALAPNLVPRDVLPRAIATNAIAGRIGAVLGPLVGGWTYAQSPHAAFILAALLLCLSFACLSLVAPHPRASGGAATSAWLQMAEGFHYVRKNRLLLGTISLDLFAVLLGGATALLPVFARDILDVGPSGLGYLRAAPALGATATALWLSWRPLKRHMGAKMLVSVALFGAATMGFGLSRSLPLSIACLVTLGAADMVSVVVRQSLMQLYTPDTMRGRVGAISTLFISASNELGETESGLLASLIGPVAAVAAGGFGAILIAGVWSRRFPELRQAETPPPDRPG